MFWWFLNLLGNKKEEMVKKVEKSDGLGFEMGLPAMWCFRVELVVFCGYLDIMDGLIDN